MSEQYIYEQPIYGEEIQYQTEINNNHEESNQNQEQEIREFDLQNYQQTKTKVTTLPPIIYQQYENQPIYPQQNQFYNNQIYFQNEPKEQLPQFKPNGNNKENEDFNQAKNFYQKPQTIPNFNIIINNRNSKNIKQIQPQISDRQPPSSSRNPYRNYKYSQQSFRQIPNQEIIIQPKIEKNIAENPHVQQKQVFEQENPQIESDFQPDIPLANSILSLSQIPYELKENENPQKNQIKKQIQPQLIKSKVKQQQSYVIPRRNPNLNLKQYEDSDNDSHFVNAVDPGSRTIILNKQRNSKSSFQNEDNNTSKKLEKKGSFISKKSLEASFVQNKSERKNTKQLLNKMDENENEIEFSYSLESADVNELENLKKTKVKKIENNNIQNFESTSDSNKDNNCAEFNSDNEEKENPIEEKIPDESNMDMNKNLRHEIYSNQNEEIEIRDVDDDLEYLPTINDILKGNFKMLSPPKKKKYH